MGLQEEGYTEGTSLSLDHLAEENVGRAPPCAAHP